MVFNISGTNIERVKMSYEQEFDLDIDIEEILEVDLVWE